MTEAAAGAPQKQYIPTPLKDYQFTHCRHCPEQCNPNEPRMLGCILTALLQAHAYRYKAYNERGWQS